MQKPSYQKVEFSFPIFRTIVLNNPKESTMLIIVVPLSLWLLMQSLLALGWALRAVPQSNADFGLF